MSEWVPRDVGTGFLSVGTQTGAIKLAMGLVVLVSFFVGLLVLYS